MFKIQNKERKEGRRKEERKKEGRRRKQGLHTGKQLSKVSEEGSHQLTYKMMSPRISTEKTVQAHNWNTTKPGREVSREAKPIVAWTVELLEL